MLTDFKTIANLGVFRNFVAPSDLPPLGRFNVIYGENGSGKTTLSRLLSILGDGDHSDYPGLSYSFGTAAGPLSKGQKYATKIRVFNSDYVDANIGQFGGPMRHILIVGQDNRALAEVLEKDEQTLRVRKADIEAADRALEKAETDQGKVFTAIAKTISEAVFGVGSRSYRKPDAERTYAAIDTPKALSDTALDVHRATVRQEQMDKLASFDMPKLKIGDEELVFTEASIRLTEETNRLGLRTAQSAALKRLTEEPDIASWVEEGVRLHREHGSDRCEFCEQPLPASRLEKLAEHFSEEDQRLKAEIEAVQLLIKTAQDRLANMPIPPKAGFYAELRESAEKATHAYVVEWNALTGGLRSLYDALAHKLLHRSTSYTTNIVIDVAPFQSSLRELASVVEAHNAKTEDFDQQKKKSKRTLEEHYLATVNDQITEYAATTAEKKAKRDGLRSGAPDLPDKRGIVEIEAAVRENRAKVLNAHQGGEQLTALLRKFLGRTDLKLESGVDGYRVMRAGSPASRLSEGEKTAIAFLYFIVHLSDHNFNVADGIVVIDDPISSLDSTSIYQAFSFLKNAVKDAKQVLLLTHNYDFLRLVLNWFHGIKKAGGKKAYYMLICTESAGGRDARITNLDQLLQEHATEYNYLFKLLYTYQSDGTISSCYHMPNVARKVLETFLEFYSPSHGSTYDKLESCSFDSHKKTAIYKFANDLSHSTGKAFDPALVSETQKNVVYLLEMIKQLAPAHYDGLEKLCI